ncbi:MULTISPECIES: MFS transporter [Actinotignum]|uniref:MFS transporter n=1 Tax=Actinotignum TaxID=1653174 RepID=UPI0025516812|nr:MULTISPECIES: MFS transporter [Actinotignum]MDE1536364.1 MFS transporter [Actinotignum schaalii]MDK7271810.1 MFS transporter [Actinotignum schaalii]MDY5150747.1 MFS transporter [Actinotignum timonense]
MAATRFPPGCTPAPDYYRWRAHVFLVVYIGYVFAYTTRNNLKVVSVRFMEEEGWSLYQVGFVLSAFTLAYGFGKIIFGMVADRVSLRRLFGGALIISGILCIITGFPSSPQAIAALTFANGLVQSALAPAALVLLGAWYPNSSRGSRVAIWNTSQNLGAALLPLLAGAFTGWSLARFHIFLVPGLLTIAVGIWAYRTGADRPWRQGLPTLTMLFGPAGTPQLSTRADGYWPTVVRAVLTNRWILTLVGINTLLYCIRFGVINWIVIFAAAHATGRDGQIVLAGAELAAIPASFAFGAYAARYPNRASSAAMKAMLALAAALAAWPHLAFSSSSVALALLLGALIYGPQVSINMLTLSLVPDNVAGAATGVVGAAGYLAGETLANFLIPHLVTGYGWTVAYTSLALTALICAAGYASLRGPEMRSLRY